MSRPSTASILKYQKKAYDRLSIYVPKGRAEDIVSYLESKGESVNGLVNRLLQAELNMSSEEWKEKKIS